MIKKVLLGLSIAGLVLTTTAIGVSAGENDAYYENVDETTGQTLAATLHTTLENTHTTKINYGDLWGLYGTSDVLPGTKIIWDTYSDCIFTLATDQAGTYSVEGDAYNREHMIPQSWFNKDMPMVADAHHIFATDGLVNNKRSNYPHGEVSNASYTSLNGGKLGTSSSTLYSGTVFEPIDEYKGDVARAYMYMAIRYSDKLGSWKNESTAIFQGTYPYLTPYAIDMYTKWAKEDPVSDKEYIRNNAIADRQGVRNPFVDHPEWANIIWENSHEEFNSNTVYSAADVDAAIAALTPTSDNKTIYTVYNKYCRLNTPDKADVQNADTLFERVEAIAGTGVDLSDLWDEVRSRPDYTPIAADPDQAKVNAVIDLITALPEPSAITANNKDTEEPKVNAANDAYKALNRVEKPLVTNAQKLKDLVEVLEVLNSTKYELVTNFFSLKEGNKVIIVANSVSKAMGDVTGKYRSGVDVTSTNNEISIRKSSTVNAFTLAQGKTEGTFAFQDGDYFLSASSDAANLVNANEINALSSWDIEIDSNGVATIVSQGASAYTMVWNNNYSDFTTILNPINTEKVKIYKVNDGTAPVTPTASLKFTRLHTKSSLKFVYDTTTTTTTSLTADSTDKYQLVENVSELVEGSKIVIVSVKNSMGLSTTQNSNNIQGKAVTLSSDGKSVTISNEILVLTLEEGTSEGSFALSTGTKYLYAPDTSKNYLRQAGTKSANGSFTFAIANGVATIQSVGNTSRGTIRYNTVNSGIFSCYAPTSGEDVAIFKLAGSGSAPVANTTYSFSNVSISFTLGMEKSLYNELKASGENVTFGMEISTDGATPGSVTSHVVYVGSLYSDKIKADGSFCQFVERKLIQSNGYTSKFTVRAFVKIGDKVHYARATEYSVKSLVEYYIANASALGITGDKLAALRAFNKQL